MAPVNETIVDLKIFLKYVVLCIYNAFMASNQATIYVVIIHNN